MKTHILRATLALALGAAALPLPAADFQIVVADAAGVGFNDPTPATPVGGNTGTTIGAQRLIVFQEAARVWGALLPSNVTIKVSSSFSALTCSARFRRPRVGGRDDRLRELRGGARREHLVQQARS